MKFTKAIGHSFTLQINDINSGELIGYIMRGVGFNPSKELSNEIQVHDLKQILVICENFDLFWYNC